ncbi:MAG: DUF1934 domain-containing protein [Oscillospiraceae bacterium]|nr:DUF1934 domain-containing protein [Oscillospiraceae bacterium]
MKNVIISIKGTQRAGDSEVIEFVTCGELWREGEFTAFSYMESEMTGMEGTRTTFRVSPQRVTLTREGTTSAQMVFEQGKKHVFLYETPYGSTSLGVDTRRLVDRLDDTGGDMELQYAVDVDSAIVSENSFIINVREPSGTPPTPKI